MQLFYEMLITDRFPFNLGKDKITALIRNIKEVYNWMLASNNDSSNLQMLRGREGEPHISDLRTPSFAKLTSEPYISGSEPHTTGSEPHQKWLHRRF